LLMTHFILHPSAFILSFDRGTGTRTQNLALIWR
jgi:hypothetical protein